MLAHGLQLLTLLDRLLPGDLELRGICVTIRTNVTLFP